jgi:hypothetical protein
MRPLRTLSTSLAVFVSWGFSASAGPITLSASYFTGLDKVAYTSSLTLPDVAGGGSVLVDEGTLNAGFGFHPGTPFHKAVNTDFSFLVMGHAPGTPGSSDQTLLTVSGHVGGSIDSSTLQSHLAGGYDGTATSVGLGLAGSVPAALLDLIHHPERIHVHAYVSDGYLNDLYVKLTIDPAGPGTPLTVPEPTALATFAIVIAWIASRRRAGGPS